MSQTVEAVLISGPRKGEIIELSEEKLEEWSESDIRLLNDSLDGIIAALNRLSLEVDLTIKAFREREEAA